MAKERQGQYLSRSIRLSREHIQLAEMMGVPLSELARQLFDEELKRVDRYRHELQKGIDKDGV